MRSDWIVLNKLWQYTGGCTTRKKSYITRKRELIMFPLSNFSDSVPWLHPFCCCNYPSSILLFQVFDVKKSSFWSYLQQQKIYFSIITYYSVNSCHDFIYHLASGFTASTHKWPICVPIFCYTISYTRFLAEAMETDPSLPFQAFLWKFG